MLTVYGVYRSRASRPLWLLEETGTPFQHVPVVQQNRAKPGQLHSRSPEFIAINPEGHIPALDDNGMVLRESLAMTLYLARKYGGTLGPQTLEEEGQMLMWAFFAACEVEPHALAVLFHSVANPYGPMEPAKAQAGREALVAPFRTLNAHLEAHNGTLVGGRFTVADILLAEVLRYARSDSTLWAKAPALEAWLNACHARPAFKAMWAKREAEPA